MKKLKIILQYNWVVYLIFSISVVYSLIFINLPHYSKYQIDDNSFKVQITDIFIDGNYLSLKVNGKEKMQATYYFKSLDEKKNFLNNYKLGDLVHIKGNLSIPNNNTNPNLFNYKKYLYYDGIHYVLNIDDYKKISDNKNILYQLKNIALNRINNIDKVSSYLKALILGDSRYINIDITNIYQEIGISHLFAISGMHITVLSGILLFILKKIHFNEIVRYCCIIVFLLIYSFITGFSPSILRATTLFILLSINKMFNLKIKTFNVFLLTIAIIITINPFIIFKVGFQFSSIISGTLILFNSLINNCKGYFNKLLMTSFISFLIGIPICIYNFYQINILSTIYNLFFVPFMSFLLFPLSLLTFIFPVLENLLLIIINILEEVAKVCYMIPSTLIFKKPNLIIFIFYFFIIFNILKNFKKNKKILFLLILILGIHYSYNHIFSSDYIIFLDIGQGDSIFLHSKGKSILIDTGGRIEYSREDWEKRYYQNNIVTSITVPLLKSFGIRKIDYLVLTHGDYDHIGEAINLVNNFKVEKVIFNCGDFNELEKDLIEVLDKKKIPYYSCIKKLNIDDNKLYFLNNKDYKNENDNSSVIYTQLNNHKFLFMGDAGVEVEKNLIEKYNLQNIDVLKVGHHGSKTSSSKEFIDTINPEYSVISVGNNNRYGHPNSNVLENLSDSQIYRTDQDGSIMFKIKNKKLKIETCAP